MTWLQNHFGLVEAAFTLGGVSLFVWWQMRQLNRDVAAREAREREDAARSQAERVTPGQAADSKAKP